MHNFIHDSGAAHWLSHALGVFLMIFVLALLIAGAWFLASAFLSTQAKPSASGGNTMSTRKRTAAIGLALILGAGLIGAAGAQAMMGGSMMARGGMMQSCPMMGGQQQPGGMMGSMHGGGMGMGGGMMSGDMMGGMHGAHGMMSQLDLTDEQRATLRELRSEQRRAHFERMADMMDLRDEMHALMAADRPDPEAVRELHGRMAELHGDMLADGIEMRNRMRDLLTEEQLERMRQGAGQQPGMMGGQGPGSGMQPHHGGSGRHMNR
ncbi:MAG: Spy/CpxP family protein refolding chaperone [Ectothiorhodospiraceae bacterium]|nr:Spy/CpxP family protein refolding chaperone [Ectothiorhodospiraceae bacterium]